MDFKIRYEWCGAFGYGYNIYKDGVFVESVDTLQEAEYFIFCETHEFEEE